ncbi:MULTISPECIES: bifunctional 2-polyprenyl-6-hydroxyphenol methylase/3-demethylubiquinol 3-O-methyltransferase UbiG [unclassified Iodidimonas]|uniref:bifunctional 2-polyprenyl-6-hydroxyphenol methylase/3-demethylubiquinol 3-O-methyltransferase UbiG n=1 Tax=unclassified Iodidimonas TaxID=2626145 RepID=UPI002482F29E|nr:MULTISPECIES: bifunctional 2-polyprenyl-6-hydroxyphenol methylase/3-demethylubiquinol 3-O-methyltransferase UbiG [unclassified Iodidimonas]
MSPNTDHSPKSATIDPAEARQFADVAAHWWDPKGPFRPLHKLNPARLDFIRKAITDHKKCDAGSLRPFQGQQMVDLGCGGGLICEPLARLGADVTGLDVSDETIAIAQSHARSMGLPISYLKASAEDLADEGKRYDVVLALEVIEHVADPKLFLKAVRQLVKADGLVIFSTLNRTARSFAVGIVAAEYLLGWVPRGTHDWKKFVTPAEMTALLGEQGFDVGAIAGLSYDLLGDRWHPSHDCGVNYIGWAKPLKTG